MKKYTLDHFGGNRFALAEEQKHEDVLTDYHPGIWGIETQKKAVEYTLELINEGHEVVVGMGDILKISRVLKKAQSLSYADLTA